MEYRNADEPRRHIAGRLLEDLQSIYSGLCVDIDIRGTPVNHWTAGNCLAGITNRLWRHQNDFVSFSWWSWSSWCQILESNMDITSATAAVFWQVASLSQILCTVAEIPSAALD